MSLCILKWIRIFNKVFQSLRHTVDKRLQCQNTFVLSLSVIHGLNARQFDNKFTYIQLLISKLFILAPFCWCFTYCFTEQFYRMKLALSSNTIFCIVFSYNFELDSLSVYCNLLKWMCLISLACNIWGSSDRFFLHTR